jgi:hypothetical protein
VQGRAGEHEIPPPDPSARVAAFMVIYSIEAFGNQSRIAISASLRVVNEPR